MGVFVLITRYFMMLLLFYSLRNLFSILTFIKPHCIFVLKKLHFGVFMGESLSPLVFMRPWISMGISFQYFLLQDQILVNYTAHEYGCMCGKYLTIPWDFIIFYMKI